MLPNDIDPIVAVETIGSEEPVRLSNRRVIPLDDAYKAFQIISANSDLDYVTRLGKMLNGLSEAAQAE